MGDVEEKEIIFDEKTAALLVKDAAELVIQKLIVDQNIRLDDQQMNILAGKTAEFIKVDIDYPAISKNVFETFTDLKSNELFLNEAIRGDLFEKIKKRIPVVKDGRDGKEGNPGLKGADYILTAEDRADIAENIRKKLPSSKSGGAGISKRIRADIAEETLGNLLVDKKSMEMIVSAVAADERIVSRDGFRRKLKEIRDMITLSQKQSKGSHINAGISGQDMIAEINKVLGTVWQGGGGGIADLTLPPIIKTIDAVFALNEAQNVIEYQNGANNRLFTIPLNSSIAFPIGSWFEIWRTGAGEITVQQENSGTQTFRSVLGDVDFKLDNQDGFSVTGLKTDTDTWLFKGNLKAV